MPMVEIEPSAAERSHSALTTENLRKAVDAVRTDGFVVLKDVVDPDHIDILRERVLQDVDRFVNRPDAPFNWNRGNVQQELG